MSTESPGLGFPCNQCGAKLSYDASSQGMACPYCGHKEAVAPSLPSDGGVREIPIEEGLRLAQRGLGVQVSTITCKECGATVHVGQGERTTSCAFCGSKEVLAQETNQGAIRPESLLPFRVPKDQANRRFGEWLGGLWFRPSDLKKLARLQEMGGVYVPFWTFDAFVSSQWTAERGWHYYVTETYTETVNGQQETRTRQVQHTRWESAAGARSDGFDDVLVCAGRALPQNLVDKLSTFDTKQLVAYRPEFLAGWRAEAYAVDLMPGFELAQGKMASVQEGRCAGDIGGDTHRSLSVANSFARVTFKHVLLPVWIAAYRYNGKVFRFLVNGQTAEVVGEAPYSFWKIFFLVVGILALIGAIVGLYASQNQDAAPPNAPAPAVTIAPAVLPPAPPSASPAPPASASASASAAPAPSSAPHPKHVPPKGSGVTPKPPAPKAK